MSERCNIPAQTMPPCDLEWGHDGDQHANAGDGFYARDHDKEHHRRQHRARRRPLPVNVLLGARQDTIHADRGRGRLIRSKRIK